MKLITWQFTLGAVLVLASALVYMLQAAVFGKTEDTLFYLLQDLAFLPIQVLLVTLILNQLFKKREKLVMQKKMNMVIGAFFTEAGTELLKLLREFDASDTEVGGSLLLRTGWTAKDFTSAEKQVVSHVLRMDSGRGDLPGLKSFLSGKRGFLLGLLENPNLLEHDSFTELLWAVQHLTEELAHRPDTAGLTDADYEHLSNDIRRSYAALLKEWLLYNRHLSEDYPFIFSLVVRTNPYDPDANIHFK